MSNRWLAGGHGAAPRQHGLRAARPRTAARYGAALFLTCATEALAHEGAAAEPQRTAATGHAGDGPVYPATFFAPYQPQTALDMLERTPGFTLAEGSFVRGFGGAAGNVLVDGQRPTVKTGGIAEVLRRIPAQRVERIALLRGGEAAEAQGQLLVANVVLKADAAGAGTATLGLAYSAGHFSPSGRINYARKLGGWQTSLELSGEVARYPSHARLLDRGTDGALVRSRKERSLGTAPEAGLAASASRAVGGGTLTFNLRLGDDTYRSHAETALYAGDFAGPPDGQRRRAYEEHTRFAELGTDWTRPLGQGWITKLVGLARLQRDRTGESYAEAGYRSESRLDREPSEFVARATLGREGAHRLRPEVGGELVWNTLTSRLSYTEDRGSGPVPIALSGADARVTELRGEAFANLDAALGRTVSAELGLAWEFSRIRVTGDTANSQSLAYFKPSATLVWTPSGRTELRLGARRTVDQLDFGDFAASVDQADGREIGGNAALRPARVTRAFLRLDHRWGAGGALSLELFDQRHRGLLGYFLLPSGEQALGAIGNARQRGLTAQATVPLKALLAGAQAKFDGTLRTSRIVDPITGAKRRIDALSDSTFSAEFRHDIPAARLAWGIRQASAQTVRYHFVDEYLRSRQRSVWSAYVETTALAGFKAVLTVEGIGGRESRRRRLFYAPDRQGALAGSEDRRLREGASVSLTLTRSL
jgi:hypothetical protein